VAGISVWWGMSDMAHILIVDDNILNLELARDVLELEGYEVSTAATGEEGVKFVRNAPPDLVLMDLRMPGLSGLEALEFLRNDGFHDLPVVVLTASAMKGERENLIAKGFNGYLEKPINLETFAAEVAAFLPQP